MKWSVGLTTLRTPEREAQAIRTYRDLLCAGFQDDEIIVCTNTDPTVETKDKNSLADCIHWPTIGAFGNWVLTAWEIYLASPRADRYAIFQDDIELSLRLREYLEMLPFPFDGYLNLITYPENSMPTADELRLSDQHSIRPWYRARNEWGLGAQGLVFTNATLRKLFVSPSLVNYVHNNPTRSQDGIDGVVKTACKFMDIHEYVHPHSLIRHINSTSTLHHPDQPECYGFLGSQFDLMSLVAGQVA